MSPYIRETKHFPVTCICLVITITVLFMLKPLEQYKGNDVVYIFRRHLIKINVEDIAIRKCSVTKEASSIWLFTRRVSIQSPGALLMLLMHHEK